MPPPRAGPGPSCIQEWTFVCQWSEEPAAAAPVTTCADRVGCSGGLPVVTPGPHAGSRLEVDGRWVCCWGAGAIGKPGTDSPVLDVRAAAAVRYRTERMGSRGGVVGSSGRLMLRPLLPQLVRSLALVRSLTPSRSSGEFRAFPLVWGLRPGRRVAYSSRGCCSRWSRSPPQSLVLATWRFALGPACAYGYSRM